jgi:hypothetical protein
VPVPPPDALWIVSVAPLGTFSPANPSAFDVSTLLSLNFNVKFALLSKIIGEPELDVILAPFNVTVAVAPLATTTRLFVVVPEIVTFALFVIVYTLVVES